MKNKAKAKIKEKDIWPEEKIERKKSNLLSGKVKIWNIPREYRDKEAYLYAIRYLGYIACQHESEYMYTEKKVLENLLISDIIAAAQEGDEFRLCELHSVHEERFQPAGNPNGQMRSIYCSSWPS